MPNTTRPRRWASLARAAKYYDCSTDTIRRYIANGLLPGHRVPNGKTIKVDLNDLDDLAQQIPSARHQRTAVRARPMTYSP